MFPPAPNERLGLKRISTISLASENPGSEARMLYNGAQGATSSSFLKPSNENQVNAVTSPHLQDLDSDRMGDRQYTDVFTTCSTMRRSFALWT